MVKTNFISAMLSVLSVTVFGGIGDNPLSSEVKILRKGDVMNVIYESNGSHPEILIMDEKRNIIFSEEIMEEKFIRPYNFSELPFGEYMILIQDEYGVYPNEVYYNAQPAKDELTAHLSKLKEKDQQFLLALPNQKENEIVITVYDSERNMLYEGVEKISGDFAQVYHFKNLDPRATVTFQVSDQSGATKTLQKN